MILRGKREYYPEEDEIAIVVFDDEVIKMFSVGSLEDLILFLSFISKLTLLQAGNHPPGVLYEATEWHTNDYA